MKWTQRNRRRIILLIAFLALSGMLFLLPKKSVVFAATNTFQCKWDTTAKLCLIKGVADCDYAHGYIPDDSCQLAVDQNTIDAAGICDTSSFPCKLASSLPTSTPAPKQCSANNIQVGEQAIIGINYGSASGGKSLCVEVYKDGKYPPVYSSIYGDEVLLGTVGGEAAARTPAISEAGAYRVFTGFKYGLIAMAGGCNKLYAKDPSEYTDICESTFQATAPGTTPAPALTPYDPTCGGDQEHIKTALGCLPVNIELLFNPGAGKANLMGWAIGIGAGMAFLLGLYGALLIIISAGNPEKMQAGRELITSAISGLLFIIFAVMLLQVIGTNVLGLF